MSWAYKRRTENLSRDVLVKKTLQRTLSGSASAEEEDSSSNSSSNNNNNNNSTAANNNNNNNNNTPTTTTNANAEKVVSNPLFKGNSPSKKE